MALVRVTSLTQKQKLANKGRRCSALRVNEEGKEKGEDEDGEKWELGGGSAFSDTLLI